MSNRRKDAIEILAVGLAAVGAIALMRTMAKRAEKQVDQVKHVPRLIEPATFAVQYSANGADFAYPRGEADKPTLRTLNEARQIADRFAQTAQAIDGKAQIVNWSTGEIVQ